MTNPTNKQLLSAPHPRHQARLAPVSRADDEMVRYPAKAGDTIVLRHARSHCGLDARSADRHHVAVHFERRAHGSNDQPQTWGTRGVSCVANLGELKEAPAPSAMTECDVTLSQAERRNSASCVARKVQRLEHRHSKPLMLTSAQPCDNAGEEIVHVPAKAGNSVHSASAEHPLPSEDLRASGRWTGDGVRDHSGEPQHALAEGQPERGRRGAEGRHLHVRRALQPRRAVIASVIRGAGSASRRPLGVALSLS